jgi:hypothetical protein
LWQIVPESLQVPLVLVSNDAAFSYLVTDHRIGSFTRSTAVPTIGGRPHFEQINGGHHVFFCACCTSWGSKIQGPVWILIDDATFQSDYSAFKQSSSTCFSHAWAVRSPASSTWNCASSQGLWPACNIRDNFADALISYPSSALQLRWNPTPGDGSNMCVEATQWTNGNTYLLIQTCDPARLSQLWVWSTSTGSYLQPLADSTRCVALDGGYSAGQHLMLGPCNAR